jgi:hypothetical protein
VVYNWYGFKEDRPRLLVRQRHASGPDRYLLRGAMTISRELVATVER